MMLFLSMVMVFDLSVNCLNLFYLPSSALVSLHFPNENVVLHQARGLEGAHELSAFNFNKLLLFTVVLVSLELYGSMRLT